MTLLFSILPCFAMCNEDDNDDVANKKQDLFVVLFVWLCYSAQHFTSIPFSDAQKKKIAVYSLYLNDSHFSFQINPRVHTEKKM